MCTHVRIRAHMCLYLCICECLCVKSGCKKVVDEEKCDFIFYQSKSTLIQSHVIL